MISCPHELMQCVVKFLLLDIPNCNWTIQILSCPHELIKCADLKDTLVNSHHKWNSKIVSFSYELTIDSSLALWNEFSSVIKG